jgi:hypothetical protein
MPTKAVLLADVRTRIAAHQRDLRTVFAPLADTALCWRPDAKEWSILHCFDHLNHTHVYYRAKIDRAMAAPVGVKGRDEYRASFWGGVYMFFALNPRFSFPTPDAIAPADVPARTALDVYLQKQDDLLATLDQLAGVDLIQTRIPIEKSVQFNLGDCLKILVYHDALHIRQAQGVLARQRATATR